MNTNKQQSASASAEIKTDWFFNSVNIRCSNYVFE